MNEIEKRRQELLNQTRRRYGNTNPIPAIHPRYRATYNSMYHEEEIPSNSGLGFRVFLAVILFFLFVAIDQSKETIARVDSNRIVNEIEREYEFEKEIQEISCKLK